MSLSDVERVALQKWAKEPGADIFIDLIEKKLLKRYEHFISQEMQTDHAIIAWNNGHNAGMKYLIGELTRYKKELEKE